MSEERKIGENFDEKTAGDIFDKLRNVEGKIKPKQDGKFKNISDLMNEANYLKDLGKFDEAIELYKQIIFALPDSQKAYEALIDIYQKQGDVDSERDLLKKAKQLNENKKSYINRLDEINLYGG